MMIAAICMKNFRSHVKRLGLLKFNSLFDYCDPFYLKNIISTSAFPIYYPLHTVSRICDPVPCDSRHLSEKETPFPPNNFVIVHESCLCADNKKPDCGLINYITDVETRDLWRQDISSDDFLLREEFKSVLARSCFHYDVNVVNHKAIEQLLTSAACGSLFMPVEMWSGPHNNKLNNKLLLSNESTSKEADKSPTNMRNGLPTEEQLLNIINRLCHSLLHFFKEPHDFAIYHKNIVFQNNIRGITTRGISPYAQQMYLMRIYGRINYAQVSVEIMKITHHLEDGTVRVRWRVSGTTRQRILALLWKYKDSTWKKMVQENPEWLDGFSIFNVGDDGLIYKHVCDKMIPEEQEERLTRNNSLRSKLLKLLGLQPPVVSGLSAMLAISPIGQNSDIISPTPSKTK